MRTSVASARPEFLTFRLILGLWLVIAATLTTAQAQVIVGPNVNMGGGPATFTPPSTIIGDPFLQRQNEPSIAVSSRNPCHLLAGANDYRGVDVEEAAGEVGDAWLGVFKSFDCGATWTSTLLPGHKLDTSAQGLASPLKGLAAAADATVRAGTSGIFYYSGISFNRGAGEPSKVFVARFIDNNNKDGGDPIEYAGTAQIDLGTSGQFLDKPWVVADVPRGGVSCTVNGRSVPAGPVYLVYTSFVGGDNNVHSKIMFSRSTDCGATWSNPSKLSESVAQNQGTTIAIDPGTGDIHIAWREFAIPGDSGSRNAILFAKSTDGGKSFTKAAALTPSGYQFQPFDQISSPLTFRTNAYPTITVVPAESEGRAAGQPGRVYVAWSARGFAPLRAGQTQGDARIVMSSSIGGQTWTNPRATDSYAGAGHQIMPALAFAGGKMALAYYDLREDASQGFDDLVFEYGQEPFNECMVSPGASTPLGFAAVLDCIVKSTSRLSRRHTLDMRAAMADARCLASGSCEWSSASVLGDSSQVSRYPEGRGKKGTGPRSQLQFNRPNLPIFSKGRFPFIGDYIDIAGQSFVATADGGWAWNTGQTANRPAPVFHVSWADNRNVGTPVDKNWENFTPAVLGPGLVMCQAGQVGIRNQDVYTAQLRPELVVSAPQNSKRIAGLQRSFVVVAQNTTDTEHDYRLLAAPPAGVIASFDQFSGFGTGAPVDEIVVRIPRKSSASRTLFVGLENPPADPTAAPDVLVPVQVDEVAEVSGAPTGTFDMVYLNPDFENPDFENPDFENTELHNPDFENPDFENPDFENPDFENFTLSANSSIRNPDFENPDFENPDFENPDFENPDFENPDFENPDIENPDFENPDIENPDFENPDFENPDFENPDFENTSFQVADTTWPVRNNGNTTSAYKTNVFVKDPPAGVRYQLAVRRVFPNPAAVCAVGNTAPAYPQSVPVVNIIGPNVLANPFDRNFNDPSRDNATFSLAPGERGIITLRAYCAEGVENCDRNLVASLQGRIALGVVAQGANCVTCTGASCSLADFVKGATECRIDDGPPKDIYDPIPPVVAVLDPSLTTPEATIVVTDTVSNGYGYEGVSFSVNATDNVAVSSVACQAGTTAVALQGISGARYQFAGIFPIGTTGVTCTARDVRANPGPNTASVDFLVEVKDVTPPSFSLAPGSNPGSPFGPGNPAEATGPNGAIVTYTNPAATDNTGGPVTVACASAGGLVSGSLFPIGSTGIDCTATDESGNAASAPNLFSITVADHTPPVVSVTGQPTASVEGNVLGGANGFTFGSTAQDTVSGAMTATCTPAATSLFPLGTTTVVCSATDVAGNTGTSSFPVVVVDTLPPAITPNGPTAITIEAGSTYADAGASAIDVVSGARAVAVTGIVNTALPGAYTITYAATDGSGNAGSATRTVTVVDTTAPRLGSAAGVTAEATSPSGAVVGYSLPSVSDAVGATVACAPASGSTFAIGSTTVTCTAKDAAGNASFTTFAVVVRDTTPPVIGAVTNVTAEATSSAGATVAYALPAVTDAVGATVSCGPASGSTFPLGTTTVACVARDAALNTSTKSFTVTVSDTQAPVLTAAANPPTLLWSPNKTMTPVTVSGKITDPTLASASFKVVDEYGKIQPSGPITVGTDGSYSFVVSLEAYRNGNDADGRFYTITVTAVDRFNRSATATAVVAVPHNQ